MSDELLALALLNDAGITLKDRRIVLLCDNPFRDFIAGHFLETMGSGLRCQYGLERVVNNVRRRLGDPRKARELLGFDAAVSLAEGLEFL